MIGDKISWAIVGTGHIANNFAAGLSVVEDGSLKAVVSRSRESGEAFAAKYGAAEVYTDFEEMLDRAKPDIIYLAIPNDLHYGYIRTALEKGFPVLSEKPMVDTTSQLGEVLALAKEKDLFLMEGMWTRTHPAVRMARRWIAEGRIGRPMTVRASFDIHPPMRFWQPWKAGLAHAGGSLRDVGIYSLAMANMVFPEEPKQISSVMRSNGEVDTSFRMLLDYGEGRSALIGGAFDQAGCTEAEFVGDKGRIVLGPLFWKPTQAAFYGEDGTEEIFTKPFEATGFECEIRAVQEALRTGKKECADYTTEEAVLLARIIEKTRREWGIIYQADQD